MKVSVVTPSYQQAAYLEATLDSVLGQGYPELEYVVVDGGSTDGSREAIERRAGELAWWASEPDDGHYDAVVKGFARTDGEIMAWLNSSDLYFPWTLKVVGEVFTDLPEVEWIVGLAAHLGEDGALRRVSTGRRNRYDLLCGDRRSLQQESVFWRRSLWERAGARLATDYRYAADYELWLRFFDQAELHQVETVLAGFRYHEERRGDTADDAWRREADAAWEAWRAGADARDLRRARLLAPLRGERGRAVRRALAGAPVPGWYRHPRIAYDYAAGSWRAR